MILCAQTISCLLTILIAAKGNGIVQLRYKKPLESGIFAKNIDKYFRRFQGEGLGGL